MSYISLIESNCRHCHRCVANCPTNAIAFLNNKPEIVTDHCILCGECYVVCPQHAKSVSSDFDRVLLWIRQGKKVHVSLAPSFVALLQSEASIKESLKKMGFASVSETSQAAAKISDHYRELSKDKSKNIITTCCPVVVSLIEKYYPQLVDQLAPVLSPMRAHGQMLKEEHPNDKIVFIGPCIAKIKEAHDHDEIDAVITFEEILDYIDDQGIESNVFSSSFTNDKARQYPTTGGILSTLIGLENDVDMMVVDGIEQVKECCQAISDHQISGMFIEMSACAGSCLNGPILYKYAQKKWKAKQIIESESKRKQWEKTALHQSFTTQYKAQEVIHQTFSDEEIEEVLQSLGKFSESDQLNCQACGYPTCIDKAIGVLEKKADPQLCLPYALSKAQSMSNLIIQYTPNGIIVVDDLFRITEINPSANRSLKTTSSRAINSSIFKYLPSEKLRNTLMNLKDVEYFIDEYSGLNKVFDHACIPIESTSFSVIILMDLTQKMTKEKEQKEHRNQILAITQKIIDEQMITVQEIAGLLGESSATSKIALENLKSTLRDD